MNQMPEANGEEKRGGNIDCKTNKKIRWEEIPMDNIKKNESDSKRICENGSGGIWLQC